MPRSKKAQKKISEVGLNIQGHIKRQGYASIYDFWVNGSKPIPKSTLHDIVSGKSDPKLSTLFLLAEGLNISLCELLGCED
jgi:hypothetical protein